MKAGVLTLQVALLAVQVGCLITQVVRGRRGDFDGSQRMAPWAVGLTFPVVLLGLMVRVVPA